MSRVDPVRFLRAVVGVIGEHPSGVALHEPEFNGNEWTYVKECLDTGWVSSAGSYVDRFESDLAAYLGVRRAVVVVNGTAALHISLLLAGVAPGDEVIIPTLTFVATANAVAYCGAIPHFADSSIDTLGLDPFKLADHLRKIAVRRGAGCVNRDTGRHIAAVVPMHTFGHPVDLDALVDVCAQYGLPLIEDAAESLGSLYKGRHAGTFGLCGTLSFNGNKIATTGGGGAIVTSDEALGAKAKHITTTSKVSHPWTFEHDQIGFNYRMPNINAALGCAQLEQIEGFLAAKRALAEAYGRALEGVEGLRMFREPPFVRSNYWLNAVLVEDPEDRETLLRITNEAKIRTRPAWTPMHRLPMFGGSPRADLSVAERIAATLVNLPSSSRFGMRCVSPARAIYGVRP